MQRISYHSFITFFLFLLWGCGENSSIEMDQKEAIDNRILVSEAQFSQSEMRLAGFEEIQFSTKIKVIGSIDVPPENKAEVSAIYGGFIKDTPLLVGNVVEKGQVLVTMENPEFIKLQQEYLEINEKLRYLEAEYKRQKTMFSEEISSQKNYLKAESEYKTALSIQTGLTKQLELLNISPSGLTVETMSAVVSVLAPISGRVKKVNVSRGVYVSPASIIIEIINSDHIHLELAVFEKDIMKVHKGQAIDFKIPEASLATYQAEVYLVGTTIEPNRTAKVHAHLENEAGHDFLIGMFVDASIAIDSIVEKALPKEAVVMEDGNSYILLLDEQVEGIYYFKKQLVQVKTDNDVYIALAGIGNMKKDSKVLVKGAFALVGE